MLRRQPHLFAGFGLLALSSVAIVGVSCSSDGGDDDATGGTVGSSGRPGAGAGTGGKAASGGGGGASAGTSGVPSGGSGGGSGGGSACTPVTASEPLITDFETPSTGAGQYLWGKATGFNGGTYTYSGKSMPPLASTFTGGVWTTTGRVSDYSGVGMWFSCKTDASMFNGLQFDIRGNVASVTFRARVASNEPYHMTNSPNGSCMAGAGCNNPSVAVPVTGTTTSMKYTWPEIAGGNTSKTADPKQLVGLQWELPCGTGSGGGTGGAPGVAGQGSGGTTTAGSGGASAGAATGGASAGAATGGASAGAASGGASTSGGASPGCTPYDANLVIDNVRFVTVDGGSGSGSGGTSGAGGANGGSGGTAGSGGAASGGTAGGGGSGGT